MSDDETSVRYGAAGSDFAAQCLEKRKILTSALSKINELSAAVHLGFLGKRLKT